MKRIALSIALVMVLAIVLTMPVFATEVPVIDHQTTVRATTDQEVWTWSVPTYIDINGATAGSNGGGNIEVTVTTIAPEHSVSVKFYESANNFNLVRTGDTDTKVGYSLYCKGEAVTEANTTLLENVTSYDYVGLAATLNDSISVTGNYSDVLSFYAVCE